jgi:hypothetical protein
MRVASLMLFTLVVSAVPPFVLAQSEIKPQPPVIHIQDGGTSGIQGRRSEESGGRVTRRRRRPGAPSTTCLLAVSWPRTAGLSCCGGL